MDANKTISLNNSTIIPWLNTSLNIPSISIIISNWN